MVEMFASTIQCFSRLFQINFCWSINQLIVLAHLQLLQKSLWKLLVVFGQHVSISFYGKHEAMPNLMAIHAIKCCCGSNYAVLVNCQLKFNEQLWKFSLECCYKCTSAFNFLLHNKSPPLFSHWKACLEHHYRKRCVFTSSNSALLPEQLKANTAKQ